MSAMACERLAPESLPAVMCLDGNGDAVFATPEASRLFDRWNSGLRKMFKPEAARRFRLPEAFEKLLADGQDGIAVNDDAGSTRGVRLRHPALPSLAVTVERGKLPMPGTQTLCYLLVFANEEEIELDDSEDASDRDRALLQLTPCERRVALLVTKGMRNGEIAEHLHRSRRTIEYQLNTIYRKLNLSCRTQLVRALV